MPSCRLSASAIPNPSLPEGKRNTLALEYSSSFSLSVTSPLCSMPIDLRWFISVNEALPIMTNLAPGRSFFKADQILSIPSSFSMRPMQKKSISFSAATSIVSLSTPVPTIRILPEPKGAFFWSWSLILLPVMPYNEYSCLAEVRLTVNIISESLIIMLVSFSIIELYRIATALLKWDSISEIRSGSILGS